MQCVYHINQGVVTDLIGNKVENYVGSTELYFFRDDDDYVTDIFGNRRELNNWFTREKKKAEEGIKTTGLAIGKSVVSTVKDVGKAGEKMVDGVSDVTKGYVEIVGGVPVAIVTGKTKVLTTGLKDFGKGGLGTLTGGLDIVGSGVGGVIKTGVAGASTATGETLKGVGATTAGQFLESDKFQRGANLAVNLALLALPGVGEAELAAEAGEAAELTEGLSAATKVAEESSAALEEASTATKAAEEAKAAAQTEEEIATADKQLEEAKAAEREAQEAHDANLKKVDDAEASAAEESKTKLKKTREALVKKYSTQAAKLGLEGSAINAAIDVVLMDVLKGGKAPDELPIPPKKETQGIPSWIWIVIVLLGALFFMSI